MSVLSSTEDRCTYFKTLFYEHISCILTILQQFIQLQRFKNISIILKGVLKNTFEWLNSSLHTYLIKYITNQQEHKTNNTRKEKNELLNQGVKTTNVQYYNIYQQSILSHTVIQNDVQDNYSYASCVIQKIKKTPKTYLEKFEFSIDKPKTGLKEIDFNIIVNNNEIDNMNKDKITHENNDLANDVQSNIEDQETQQGQTNRKSFYTLVNN